MIRISSSERARLFRYGAAGLSTTLVNILLFRLLSLVLPGYRPANLIAIVVSKVYGYFASKLFVFRSRGLKPGQLVREIISYIAARGFTGVVDYFGLILLISVGLPPFPAKVAVQGAVIALNYLLGKFVVFRQRGKPEE